MEKAREPLKRLADENSRQDMTFNINPQMSLDEIIKHAADLGYNLTEKDVDNIQSQVYRAQLANYVESEKAHPKDWWYAPDHPERLKLLKEVILEKDQDSEDEKGKPVYIKDRCPQFRDLIKKMEKERQDYDARRARIIKENKRMADMGRPLLPVLPEF